MVTFKDYFISFSNSYFSKNQLGSNIMKKFHRPFNIIFFMTISFSTTLHVDQSGSDVNGDGSSENPFATIQKGIDASSDGDIVIVHSGIYQENILWPNVPNIHLISELGPEQTTIDGNLSGSVIDFGNGQNWGSINIEGFTIKNGAANSGAGLRISFPSSSDHSLTMNKMIIENNYGSSGGAMWVSPSRGSIKLLSSIVRNNTGTAIWGNGLNDATFEIVNTLIYDNEGGAYGYGNFNAGNGLKVVNCTVVNNNGSSPNGGAFALNNGNLEVINSIIYNNQPTDITTVGSYGNITVNNSIITNDENSVTVFYPSEAIQLNWSDNYYGINPNFIDYWGDYHLSDYSLAIGAGTIEGAPDVDIEGNFRPNPTGSNPDLGAYENALGTPAYLPQLINVPSDYSTIQSALSAANETDTVLVQPGTYTENIIWPETNGIKLISAGDSSNTIIDGGGVSSVIIISPQNTNIDTTTELNGLKITNGMTSLLAGSGIFINNSSVKIKNCSVIENTGGGIYTNNSFSFVESSIIKNNSNSNYGGGLHIESSSLNLANCLVINNQTSSETFGGGGIFIKSYEANVQINISNSQIQNNFAPDEGGGIYLRGDVVTLSITESNIIENNGGAIYAYGDAPLIINQTTISNNGQDDHSSYLYSESSITMSNSIIKSNTGSLRMIGDRTEKIYSCTFDSNIGDVIVVAYCNIDSLYSNNFINNNGSCVRYVNNGGCTSLNNSFINNSASAINISPLSTNTTISHSGINDTYIGNNGGVYRSNISDANIDLHSSNFINNGFSTNDNSNSDVDLINNYWGDVSGPYHPTQNPSGQGDSISIFVNIEPWLIEPNLDAPPIPAQNTTITSTGNDFINLTWDESELGDLAGYKLYYDSDPNGFPYDNSIDVDNVTSYSLSNLSPGTTYYLAVTTYDFSGNESWYSNEVNGTTRVIQAQSLDIGGEEDLQHLITHNPNITFGYYDSMNEAQTSYQVQVSTLEDFSTVDIWDSGEVNSTDTSLTYPSEASLLLDGVTYYLRAKVGSGTFYSEWATLTFRMNSTITMSSLTFDPELDENGVYTEGFPTMSSAPTDPEGDDVSVFYYLSDNATFSSYLDSALVLFDNANQESVSWQPSIDPVDNQQYWVKAKGWDGYEYGNETTVYTFVINNANDTPASFALLTPEDESEVTSLTPLLDWEVSQDPDPLDTVSYTLYLDTPEPGVLMINTGTLTTFQIDEPLMDNTEYFWRVVARDVNEAEIENAGGYHSFTVNTANDLPGDFALLAPENGSMVTDLTPTMLWEEPTDADDGPAFVGTITPNLSSLKNAVAATLPMNSTNSRSIVSYDVYVSTDNVFTDVTAVTVENNSYTPNNGILVEDMMYYWKVVATDDDGGQTESGVYSFWTNGENSVPSEFTLLTPLTNEEVGLIPTFSWTESSDADLADQIYYFMGMGTELTSMEAMDMGNNLQYTPQFELLDNTEYHWNVTAMDQSGAMHSTEIQSFFVNVANDAPVMVSLVAPLESSIQMDLTPNFYWTESEDPDPLDHLTYTMSWWEAGSEEMQSVDLDSNGVTPAADLVDNMEYHWSVNTVDLAGAESMSELGTFFTDAVPEPPATFATLTPANEAVGVGTEVEFTWEAAVDPDPIESIHYRLAYVNALEDWQDTSLYVVSEPIEGTSITLTLEDNSQYYWGVIARDSDGFIVGSNDNMPNTLVVGTLSIDEDLVPDVFALHQNYPNPFNPTTQIQYDLPKDQFVSITIFDVMGRKIRSLKNTNQTAGYHTIRWDARNDMGEGISAGVYIITIQTGELLATKKMVLLK